MYMYFDNLTQNLISTASLDDPYNKGGFKEQRESAEFSTGKYSLE